MSGIQSIRDGLSGKTTRVIVVTIIITFIGSVGWAGFFSQGNTNVVAKVGSQEITNADLSFELSAQQFSLSQRFPDQTIEDEVILNLSTNVLIGKFAVLDFLEKNDLTLTDTYVYKQLASEDQFLENGKFSIQRFEAFARSNGFIPSDYLKRVKEDLLINIWRQSLAGSNFITEAEAKNSLELAEQERDISFIKFPSSKFRNSVDFDIEDLQNFYETNKSSYISPEKAKVSYIYFDAKDLKNDIDISNEDINFEYEEYVSGFDTTTRKSVSHIMLNINDERNVQQASDELQEVKQRLNNGEKFSDLVLEISEDEGTKNLNGSLGITDGTLLPPEFEEALSTMKEGEVYGPIDLLSSVHLIKLDELIQPIVETIEQRSASIKENLITRRSEDNFVSLLDQVSELAFSSGSIADIAPNFSQELVTSEYFSINAVPELLNQNSIIDFIFNDSMDGNFPEVIEISPLSAVLIQVGDMVEETQLTFDTVKMLVESAYISEESSRSSQAFIEGTIEELVAGKALETLSTEENIQLEVYKNLKRDSSLLPVAAVNGVFSMPRSQSGNTYGSAIAQNGDYLIYRLDSVRQSSNVLNAEDMEGIKNFLNQQKGISEITELQTVIQRGLTVEQYN
jgi:peptidyl-prolyl cis-trans isomerase D